MNQIASPSNFTPKIFTTKKKNYGFQTMVSKEDEKCMDNNLNEKPVKGKEEMILKMIKKNQNNEKELMKKRDK
jgi:hypothetical protein